METLRLAFRALRGYGLRSALTTLGVSVGIFAITVVFVLVDSMEYSVTYNLSQLGNTVLFVHHWPWKDVSNEWHKYVNRPKATYDEFRRLKSRLTDASGVFYQARKNGATLKSAGRSLEGVSVMGVTYDFAVVMDAALAEGRYFSPIEVESGRNVCLVGWDVAQTLFSRRPYVGRTIEVAGRRLEVIGVLERKGNSLFGDGQDQILYMPYARFATMFNVTQRSIDKLIGVKAVRHERMDALEDEIVARMRKARGLRPGVEDNFSINKQEMLMRQIQRIFEVMSTVGVFISLFALLVGGFGIANIMFVSVRERTKEIGIQKALGASSRKILAQFLTEAVILCLAGGTVGIALTLGTTAVGAWLSAKWDWGVRFVVEWGDVAVGLVLSALIGLVSGIAPAYAAARLHPVEAMRAP
ncbi:MAG: ABC transporter permease [Bacteroidia bacterium]|nr:ABC transporter permease [Bacteroidia bacterium]MDW8333809.1 ABC transporter permease [Bacteroidia bacterium]